MTNANAKLRSAARVSVLGACLIAALSGAAYAASPGTASASMRVSYGDLNLASEQGNKELYVRIVSAARQVCAADQVDSRDLHARALEQSCEQQAVAVAVGRVNSPKLAALYNAHLHGG
ncbi:MAG TPA: UrcA family protein [Steroidobacteraceae bacterium]|nr:UrcA family protein [Steroidobacteraceae bacterium]